MSSRRRAAKPRRPSFSTKSLSRFFSIASVVSKQRRTFPAYLIVYSFGATHLSPHKKVAPLVCTQKIWMSNGQIPTIGSFAFRSSIIMRRIYNTIQYAQLFVLPRGTLSIMLLFGVEVRPMPYDCVRRTFMCLFA